VRDANDKPRVAVIGGGPAGLMAAETLARGGAAVTVYDQMPSVGRKFLLAGRGGLNLTHSEELELFLTRYGGAEARLRDAIETFPPHALRAWCEELGQPTFIGTSGRVFPKAMKASPLLRAWLGRLRELGVEFRLRHRWRGWDEDRLLFDSPAGRIAADADAAVLALGGASWPKLGSDGSFAAILAREHIAVAPLRPSNCGFAAGWSAIFRERFEGQPLKGIELHFEDAKVRGEAVITKTGLEGGAIYALSSRIRNALEKRGEAILRIDLRPGISLTALESSLSAPRNKQSLATFLRKAAKLAAPAAGLLHEAAIAQGRRLGDMPPKALAEFIKGVPVRLTAAAPLERAISTAGGITFAEIDNTFMLRGKPGVFVAGEMLDWEAPTGGYLLQACFATGVAAGRGALRWLAGRNSTR
jgi:uncharacterized flavoprotein (TIGR03862 family)